MPKPEKDETVDFDRYPDVRVDGIADIFRGYVADDLTSEKIIVVLQNGAHLLLDLTKQNVTGAAQWMYLRSKSSPPVTRPEAETVDFEGHPAIGLGDIVDIIEGYALGDPPVERILVVLRGGFILDLAANNFNRMAVARFRSFRKSNRYLG